MYNVGWEAQRLYQSPDALAALATALRGEAESEDQGWAALQKQKTRALEFLSVVSLAGHLVLVGEGDPSRVANLEAAGVGALADQSVDVQAAGKRLLRAIFQIIPDNTVSERIVAFQTTAGRPGNGVNGNAVVGVLGLAAVSELVHSGSFAPWGPQAFWAENMGHEYQYEDSYCLPHKEVPAHCQ